MNLKERSIKEIIQNKIVRIYAELEEGKELKTIKNNLLFRTSHGDDFHYAFLDLFNFVSIITPFKSVVTWVLDIQEQFSSPTSILEFYQELIEKSSKKEEQKKKAQIILNQINSDWDDFQKKTNGKIREISELLEWEEEKREKKQVRVDSKDTQNQVYWIIEQIPYRVFSYFITTLYALINVYTMSLIQFVINSMSSEQIYDFINNFRITSNHKENIKYILDFFKMKRNEKLAKITKNIDEKANWTQDLEAVESFIALRHIFAHKNPFLEMNEMMGMDKFSKYKKRADEKVRKFKNEQKESEIKVDLLRPLLDKFSEILPYTVFIKELGFSCYRYLCVVDNIIAEYFEYEKLDIKELLNSIKEKMKDEQDATIVQNIIDLFDEE